MKKIVIWGADNYNTLGLLRSLANNGFDITVVINGHRHGVTTASKYCSKCYYASSIDDAVHYLSTNFPITKDLSQKAVLFPGGDTYSIAGAKHYEILKDRFHMMCTTDPERLIHVTDKMEMGKTADAAGLLVPKAQEFTVSTSDLAVPFPIILKPIHSEGRVEFKTKVLHSNEELSKLKKFLNPNNIYLAQQFIPRSHDIVIYGCRLQNGELVLAGHHTLERWSDDGGGSYGHLYPEIPKYLQPDALKKFFDVIDYHGLFSAEYGYYKGMAYFYEVNLRNDGFCHLSFQAGANLPLLWVQSCLGLPLEASPVMKEAVVGINEIYDFANVIHGRISLKRFNKDKNEAKAFHFYDADDKKPYTNMRKRMIWEIPMRAILKSFRPKIVWLLSKLHI